MENLPNIELDASDSKAWMLAIMYDKDGIDWEHISFGRSLFILNDQTAVCPVCGKGTLIAY